MRRLLTRCLLVVLCLSLSSVVAPRAYGASKVPAVTKEELRNMLDSPGVIVIDVRAEGWKPGEQKIKGAVWEDPGRVRAWAGKYPGDKSIVLYCS